MSHNAGTPRAETFEAHDELPRRLQLLLAHFPQNMSSEFALAMLRKGKTEDELCAMLLAKRSEFTTAGVPPLDPESHYRSKPLRRTKL